MIFVPNFLDHRIPRSPFIYVQPLKDSPKFKGMPNPDTNMYSFVRTYRNDNTRKGLIFPLTRLWRPIELIPNFGEKCDESWTCDTAVELAKELILNPYFDDAAFIEVY